MRLPKLLQEASEFWQQEMEEVCSRTMHTCMAGSSVGISCIKLALVHATHGLLGIVGDQMSASLANHGIFMAQKISCVRAISWNLRYPEVCPGH